VTSAHHTVAGKKDDLRSPSGSRSGGMSLATAAPALAIHFGRRVLPFGEMIMAWIRFVALPSLIGLFLAATAPPLRADEGGKLKFEVYKDKAGEYRWRLKAANGQVLATPGQGYKEKAGAEHGIELVKKAGSDAKMKFEIYQDGAKEYRWRLKAANGEEVAASSEGYKAKADAEKAVSNIKSGAAAAEHSDAKE
jgi:uncharacterized protein YegP (UPF0339 family)